MRFLPAANTPYPDGVLYLRRNVVLNAVVAELGARRPAQQWFGEHDWTAVATPLADYLREVGRPVPGPDVGAVER